MKGYVYIMTNEAMPALLKIGRTKKSPEERRRELSSATGVPTEFFVAYEISSPNCVQLEKSVHETLKDCRFNRKREFFKYNLSKAIDIIRKKTDEMRLESSYYLAGKNEVFELYEAIEILGDLRRHYPAMIRTEIISVRIYQTRLRCYLEITEEILLNDERKTPLIDIKILRHDMGFIAGENYDCDRIDDIEYDCLEFDPSKPVSLNARNFLEDFDDYDKLMCFGELFTAKAVKKISGEYNSSKG